MYQAQNPYIPGSQFPYIPTARLKKLLSQAGFAPELYSGHSFRRGGASFLFMLGADPITIKFSGAAGAGLTNPLQPGLFLTWSTAYQVTNSRTTEIGSLVPGSNYQSQPSGKI